MNLRSPLLHFRIRLGESQPPLESEHEYDPVAGFWRDEAGNPLVDALLASVDRYEVGPTTITETREQADQSERSSYLSASTTLTKTREGVDQTERSYEGDPSTLLTFTREGIDKTEDSTDDEAT